MKENEGHHVTARKRIKNTYRFEGLLLDVDGMLGQGKMRLVCQYANMLQNGVDRLIRSDLAVIKIVIYIANNKSHFS